MSADRFAFITPRVQHAHRFGFLFRSGLTALFRERAVSVSGLLARVVRPSQRTGWFHNNQRGRLVCFGLHG
jgi:hypothetical protein